MSQRTAKSTALRSPWAGEAEPDRNAVRHKISKERRDLWDKLNRFVIEHGGNIISAPYDPVVRVTIETDSALPSQLAELGYRVHQCGREMRTGCHSVRDRKGKTAVVDGIAAVDIVEICLPG